MSKKSTTGVALVGTSVPNVLEVINKRLQELKEITECNYKTSGNLEGFGDIKTETKVENLIRAYSSVMGRERAYNEAAKELGLSTYPAFNISGGNSADWKQDILLRKAVIEHAETKKKLENISEQAKSFLTKEMQYEIFLKDAEEMMKSINS